MTPWELFSEFWGIFAVVFARIIVWKSLQASNAFVTGGILLIFAVGVECGENRGKTGGEPGENRGRPKEPGENRGHLGREPGENRGLLAFIYKEYRGRSGGFGTRTGGEPGGGNFLWNQRPNSRPENQRTGPPVKISRVYYPVLRLVSWSKVPGAFQTPGLWRSQMTTWDVLPSWSVALSALLCFGAASATEISRAPDSTM